MLRRALVLLLVAPLGLFAAEAIRFPADAGVRSVKDDGAIGDGVADDTAAINKALEKSGLLWFPAGTYLVSGQLRPPERKGGAVSRRILQGEGRDRVVIRLADQAAGFGDRKKPQEVLRISWGVAQAFRNSIRDLTIDVGAGNPGATACGFFASNQGSMQRVALRAGAGSGAVGLELALGDNGPLTVSDVRISGFDQGIHAKYGNGFTIENVAMEGIRGLGIRSDHTSLFLRRISYRGDGPLLTDATNSSTVLLDADLATTAVVPAAIRQEGRLLLRNVKQTGFTALVAGKVGQLAVPAVDEWHSHPALSAFPGSTRRTLGLPVEETPQVAWDPPERWVSVAAYPPTEVDGAKDWGPALQAAIDSGMSTVYFPLGKGPYPIRSEVTVRGAVQRIIGLEQAISHARNDGCKPVLTIGEGSAPTVVIEHFDSIYTDLSIRHAGMRRLLLACLALQDVDKLPGSGDLFLFDTVISTLSLAGGRCWSRGLNMEYSQEHSRGGIHIHNAGADFWMFGFKNEGDGTKVDTSAGGRSELYAYVLSNKATPAAQKPVLFTVRDAEATIHLSEGVLRKEPSGNLVREMRGGETREFLAAQAPRAGNNASALVLFGARPARPDEVPPVEGYPAAAPAGP